MQPKDSYTFAEWRAIDAYGVFVVVCDCFAKYFAVHKSAQAKNSGVWGVFDYLRTQLHVESEEMLLYWDNYASHVLPHKFVHSVRKMIVVT